MNILANRLDKVEQLIKEESFRQNKGLGNEVGYYVFDYPAKQELAVRERITYMQNKNARGIENFELVVFDLYDIIIDILKKNNFLDKCINIEKNNGFDRLVTAIGNLLRINDTDGLITQHIHENTPENAIIFLVGIGKCYPILRSHKILNSLHQTLDRVPVVLFYPGEYDGQELVLFSKIKDDNYYRAFKLVD